MNFKNLCPKKAYSSDSDDILFDFYIPTLEQAVEYDRLAGFFSSTSLAIAAKGIMGLVRNSGLLRLIVSPKLSAQDVEAVVKSHQEPLKYIENTMLKDLEGLEDAFVEDHVFALGWMIANGKLKIKVAIPYDDAGLPLTSDDVQQSGLFHQKVGILKDAEGNVITFSGSLNETAMGWLENIEEFKVFRNWELSEEEYVNADILKFSRFWSNQSLRMRVIDVPQAVERRLIEIAPPDIEHLNLAKWYKRSRNKSVELFQYQKQAIDCWVRNGRRGIYEMATGSGKTFTALGCLETTGRAIHQLVVIIACPQQHLLQQWGREIDKFGFEYDQRIIADSSNPKWRDVLADALIDTCLGRKNRIIVLTTHRTFSSDDFMTIVQTNKGKLTTFLIGDEVHGMGARKSRRGLITSYDLRLGLSATPKRWFDTAGTEVIYDYFGGIAYEFTLRDAINLGNLTPYRYKPIFTTLTDNELQEYIYKTRSIVKRLSTVKGKIEEDELLENLLFQRANIIKNATGKYQVLEQILDELGPCPKWTLVYCSPQQIDGVMKVINRRGLVAHRFTMDEGTTPDARWGNLSERDAILQEFAEGDYQVLVAMKCLDEGVDVPPARTAVLLASSGNPREYIQRIGRVIRKYRGKHEALIYDIVVMPSLQDIPPEWKRVERTILRKELARYEEIANTAINSAEALQAFYEIYNKSMEVLQ